MHLHVVPYQIQESLNDGWNEAGDFVDPVAAVARTTRVRIRFSDFTGTAMFHCHINDHTDEGMLRVVHILPAPTPFPTAPVPTTPVPTTPITTPVPATPITTPDTTTQVTTTPSTPTHHRTTMR
jgi:hypothetical protein